jgi:hypothetical protein
MEHQHIAIGANQYEVLFTTHYEFGERGSLALGHRGIQQMIGLADPDPHPTKYVSFTNEELEKLESGAGHEIEIIQFIPISKVDPVQGGPILIKAAEPARDRIGWPKRRWQRGRPQYRCCAY